MTTNDRQLEQLLEFLREDRGFDFTGYKRSTIRRRVEKRMAEVGESEVAAYLDRLQVEPDEFGKLFDAILINVTSFLRDRESWDFLSETVVPEIAAGSGPIRVWSVGCATGEEAYSIALVLADHLGLDEFQNRVKIYATDLDDDALLTARVGAFAAKEVKALPAPLQKYFRPSALQLIVRQELRRALIFGRHDLVRDAPISKLDLILCRNVLMYLNAETQARIVPKLHFALRKGGFLFLGHAELLLTRDSRFVATSLKHRVFCRVDGPPDGYVSVPVDASRPSRSNDTLRRLAFDESDVGQVVIDPSGIVVMVNRTASHQFGLSRADEGRPFRDLELSYRPVELRSLIEDAVNDRSSIVQTGVERPLPDGSVQHFEVTVAALTGEDQTPLGVHIRFDDVTRLKGFQAALEKSNHDLEESYEELQATNEELETTNEELQATNEELETTNEELQATNEELETMNEELQSTNTEMQAINDEIQISSRRIGSLNELLTAILRNLGSGLIATDEDLTVTVWNEQSHDQWGVSEGEAVGRSLMGLDIGLPAAEVAALARASMAQGTEAFLSVAARNRRGKPITCRVTCTPIAGSGERPAGVVLLVREAASSDDGSE